MRAWWRQRKGTVIGGTLVLLILAGLAWPYIWWRLQPDVALDVIVVDKTVARPDYRKHAGLFWVLSHEKVVDPRTGLPLDRTRDYVGYHPTPDGQGQIVPIPARPADLVYLSDTYGIYEDDLADRPTGARSTKIYGGISSREVDLVTNDLRPGGTLVGEFNTLATPTPHDARDRLAAAFGVRPTGWVGRHLAYLDLTPDLPEWMPQTWLAQTGRRWSFRGPGYVFVSDEGQMVVLVEGVDTKMEGLRLRFDGAAADRYGTLGNLRYDGWVEIVEPRRDADVVGRYELQLTESGATKMRGLPIGTTFPAAIRTQSAARTTYYFAGDWSDRVGFGRFDYAWMDRFKRLIAPTERDSGEPFFWGVYVPLMQRVIREAAANRPST